QNSPGLKHLIITAWKERWTEKKWSIHVKKLITSSSDMFHLADVLVSQSFIGSSPNLLMLGYISYALDCGMLSYASVISAISKHEELSKIESTKGVYNLLQQCLQFVCNNKVTEDAMELCFSLRIVLQWLLRNIEQYLKGVRDIYGSAAEELIKLNCQTLELIATQPRTAGLLTIARFAESGIWNHIETDLAVIKNTSGQHPMYGEISTSCHHVSQLSKCSIAQKPVYKLQTSGAVYHSILTLILLEVEERKLTNVEGIVQQLMLLSNVHGLTTRKLIFRLIQACFMLYLDAVDTELEQEWCAMVFLRLPKIILQTKRTNYRHKISNNKIAEFNSDLEDALKMMLKLDSLLDTIDQLREGMNCIQLFTEQLMKKDRINESFHQELNKLRSEMMEGMPSNNGQERCLNPVILLKADSTIEQLVKLFSSADFSAEPENLLSTFAGMRTMSSFNALTAAAATTGQLADFASVLINCNNVMKSSSAETMKSAQIRAVLFDITFLMVCYMIKLYDKEAIIVSFNAQSKDEIPILLHWANTWWLDQINQISSVKYESDPSRVENLIQVLRNSQEFKLSMTKWNDICINLPQAVIELLIARQKGAIQLSEVIRACCFIRDGCPLAVTMSVIAAVARSARLVVAHKDHIKVLSTLVEKSSVQSQSNMMYNERYIFFQSLCETIVSDLLPSLKQDGSTLDKNKLHSEVLQQTLSTTRKIGWINRDGIAKFSECFNMLGVFGFMRQAMKHILKETRLNEITTTVDIVFGIMRLDIISTTMYLLKHGIPDFLKQDSQPLASPLGRAIAKMAVAGLDLALNESALQQKSQLPPSKRQNPFSQNVALNRQSGQHKVRRLFSCSTEHDLSIPGLTFDDPLVHILSEFIDVMWCSLEANTHGPQSEFVLEFVKLSLQASPLLSRTVKRLIPIPMIRELRYSLVNHSRELLFAACDLGNPEIRKLAAHAVCIS
uniref:Mediator of RNA polymerase II transcription subunit 24 n=1 Tax=Ciona savignyi TaxID=51511 RepID=H2ZGH8_CIOSA